MSDSGSQYVCPLSPETMAKAKEKLHEDPNTRMIEVKALRSRLEKITGLRSRTDIHFILEFLRSCDFVQEATFELIIAYYQNRHDHPEIYDDLKPSRVRQVFDDGVLEVLDNRANDGCKVAIYRVAAWNPDRYSLLLVLQAIYLLLIDLMEEEETQVHGVHFLSNMEGLTMKHVAAFNPTIAKMICRIVQVNLAEETASQNQ